MENKLAFWRCRLFEDELHLCCISILTYVLSWLLSASPGSLYLKLKRAVCVYNNFSFIPLPFYSSRMVVRQQDEQRFTPDCIVGASSFCCHFSLAFIPPQPLLANHLSSPHFTVCHSARPLMQLLQPSSMWMLYLYLSMQGDSAQQPQLKCHVGVSSSVRYVEVCFRVGSWSSKHTTDREVRDYRQDFSHTCSNLQVPHQGQNQCLGL